MDLLIRSVAYRMQVARTTKRVRASFYSAKKNTGEMIRMNCRAAVMIIQPCDLCLESLPTAIEWFRRRYRDVF